MTAVESMSLCHHTADAVHLARPSGFAIILDRGDQKAAVHGHTFNKSAAYTAAEDELR
jgi:hypothetical protein